MDEEVDPDQSESVLCPICSTLQDNLNVHISTHSKEEILHSFSFRNSAPNASENQVNNVNIAISNSNILQRQSSVPMNASIINTPIFSPFSNMAPMASNNIMAPNYIPIPTRNVYGSTTSNIQFNSPSMPILYRPPVSFASNMETNGSSSAILPNSQFNLNSFKGSQPVINSFPMAPFINQPVHSSLVVPASQMCNISSNIIDNALPKVTTSNGQQQPLVSINSHSSSSSTGTSNSSSTIMSSIPSVGQQQTMICVLPYAQAMQPTVNPGGTFLLYGNNLLPSGSVMPEVVPAGMSYMISNNSHIGISNPVQIPSNHSMFSTSPLPNFEIKQELSSAPFVNIPTRLNAGDNFSVANLNGNSANQYIALETVTTTNKKESVESLVTDNDDNRAIIEIGKNIKILLPKSVLARKEKVKEIINKELVRALLINDAEELEDYSDEDNDESKKAISQNDTSEKTFFKPNEAVVNASPISCIPNNSGVIEQNSPSMALNCVTSSIFQNTEPQVQPTTSTPSRDRTTLVESPVSTSCSNLAIDLSTSTANKSPVSSDSTAMNNNFKAELKIEDSMFVGSLTDLSLSFMSADKNLSTIFGSNYSTTSFTEEQVLGAVEEVLENENHSNKAGPSTNFNFDCQLMQLFPQEENSSLSEEKSAKSSFQSPRPSPSKLRSYRPISARKLVSPNSNGCPEQVSSIIDKSSTGTTGEICIIKEIPYGQSQINDQPFFRGDEDSLSNDSKEVQSALYQRVSSVKPENGESNGTNTEEVMSLKASETLADSDSERATPNEEVELGVFFMSEPESGRFPPDSFTSQLKSPESLINSDRNKSENIPPLNDEILSQEGNVTAQEKGEDFDETETINMTIDSNCCILPDDAFNFIPGTETTHAINLDSIFAKQAWIDDVKPLVMSGILPAVMSPLASTSGLQKVEGSKREDEEYDFDYESDLFGESDAELGYRGHSDLEHLGCSKCKKSFKSLKEKLLHSSHHYPCLNNENPSELSDQLLLIPTSDLKNNLKKLTSNTDISASLYDNESDIDLTANKKEFKCTECSKVFPSIGKLHDHRVNSLKSRSTCPLCHKEFKKRADKVQHIKEHPRDDFRCLICNRNFDGLYSWAQHQLQHRGLVAYECAECGFKCLRKGELIVHQRKHTGERPYTCTTCSAKFITNHSLKRHLITHLKGQETECDICQKNYKNAIGLNKHKLIVHGKKKKFFKKRSDYMCSICCDIFATEKKLAWHREIHERWPKKCAECGDCFIHESNLTKHIRMKHNSSFIPVGNKDNVPCAICKKIYKKSSIGLHMRTHTGHKPFECIVCGKGFSVKCNYLSHRWVHMGVRDRPFKCKLCERSFHRKRFLESHIRSHKKIRPYTCNECGKAFIHKNNYRTHTRQHTEEKQHECEHCGKTFHRRYNLNNHVRIHTGETPYACSICRKEFTQKSNYNVHMKAFHVERHAVHEEV